jgi:hypothetical protein
VKRRVPASIAMSTPRVSPAVKPTPPSNWARRFTRAMDLNEMKRQYQAKQEQVCRLEMERAVFPECGEPVPRRIGFRLGMTRIEAEEFRMWGNRDLTAGIREYREGREISHHFSTCEPHIAPTDRGTRGAVPAPPRRSPTEKTVRGSPLPRPSLLLPLRLGPIPPDVHTSCTRLPRSSTSSPIGTENEGRPAKPMVGAKRIPSLTSELRWP